MSDLILLHKPYGVLCQFSGDRPNLSDYIPTPGVYPAGRLDRNSEGLVLLTGDGTLQARIADPRHKLAKTYWVLVQGHVSQAALSELRGGVRLRDGLTRPAKVAEISEPELPPPHTAVLSRSNTAVSWLRLILTEGRNRQVRRMTAHVGHPTLRLFRHQIGDWTTDGLAPGESRQLSVHLPAPRRRRG